MRKQTYAAKSVVSHFVANRLDVDLWCRLPNQFYIHFKHKLAAVGGLGDGISVCDLPPSTDTNFTNGIFHQTGSIEKIHIILVPSRYQYVLYIHIFMSILHPLGLHFAICFRFLFRLMFARQNLHIWIWIRGTGNFELKMNKTKVIYFIF